MVGREREMMALRRLWTEAEAGRGQFAIVSGEAGIGKSRLTQSLKEHIGQQTSRQLTGQCWSYFQHAAFHPLIEVADCAIGTSGNDSPAVKLGKLEALLERLQLDPAEHSALLASFLSIPTCGGVRPIALSPDMLRLRFIDSLTALIIRLAAEGPTLLLIEDGHWSDASTQELLTTLLDRMVGARLLVLVTCRPQFAPAFPNRAHLHQLQLDRLPPEATAALVANASRGRVLPADMVSALVERADGIPLFVEELTRMMVDTWRLDEASEAPRIDNQAIVRSIPQTLSELLVARLDQLPGTGKEVAQLGAVLGREFSFDLIDRCSHVERDRLRGGLMQLVDADLIRHQENPAGARYAFKHALVQDAAYHSLLRSQRRLHHQRVAETLEREFGELAEQQPELLAHHFLEAGAALKALPYLEKAGQRAVQRSAHSDAITHYRKAIDLAAAGEDSSDRARKELSLRLALGAPLMANKGYAHADVEANYARALELSRGLGDDSQVFLSTLGLWQFSLVGGRIAVGVELGGQLMAQAQAARDDVSIMLAHRSLATSLMLSADLERACEHTAAGLKLYEPEKHGKLGFKFGHDPGVVHGLYRAIILWLLGRGDEALEASSNALALSEELKHPMSIAFALCYSGVVENMRGEYAQARRHATAGRDLSADHQLALWLAMNTIVIGWADCGLREPRGNDIMADGIAALIRTGAKASLTLFDSAQAWGLLRMGRHEEALRVVNRAQALVHQTGEVFYKAELARLNGEALLSESSTETHESERCFREALEVARQQKARAFELRAAVSLALLSGEDWTSCRRLCHARARPWPIQARLQHSRSRGSQRTARQAADYLIALGVSSSHDNVIGPATLRQHELIDLIPCAYAEAPSAREQVVPPHTQEAFGLEVGTVPFALVPFEVLVPRHQRSIVVRTDAVLVFNDKFAVDRARDITARRQHSIREDVAVEPGFDSRVFVEDAVEKTKSVVSEQRLHGRKKEGVVSTPDVLEHADRDDLVEGPESLERRASIVE